MFTDILREATRCSHDQVERSYPFSYLLSPDINQQIVNDVVESFKFVFYCGLEKLKFKHHFYAEMYDFLNQTEFSGKNMVGMTSTNEASSLLYLEYLLVGSRLGNEVVLHRNPKILEMDNCRFFSIQIDDLWRQVQAELNDICEIGHQKQLIEDVRSTFIKLATYGSNLRKSS